MFEHPRGAVHMLRYRVDFYPLIPHTYYMSDYNTQADNTIFGGFGEFVDTPDMTADEWAEHDAQVAAEIAAHDAEMNALYAEAYGDVFMSQFDEPDFF